MTEDQIRVFDALLGDAREFHRALVMEEVWGSVRDHSSLDDDSEDTNCLACGHINEAEYVLAEASGAHD